MALPQLSSEDYETIEAAVMETARGRWFLNEFARRNRTADTNTILEALGKFEKAAGSPADTSGVMATERARALVSVIAQLYAELESIRADADPSCPAVYTSPELGSLPQASAQSAQQILAAVEDIQETAWALRELGINPDFCQKLDRDATDIYVACTFHEVTTQRLAKLVQAFGALERQIGAFAETAGIPAPAKNEFFPEPAQKATATEDKIQLAAPVIPKAETSVPTLIEAQSVKLPKSSLPQMQEALAVAWPEEKFAAPDAPANFQLADYSFEEKLALFS